MSPAPTPSASASPTASASSKAPCPEGESFDLVLANLPYVAERDWPTLQPEVTQWEPREALLAGSDGLDAYRAFVRECGRVFPPYGGKSSAALAVEIGVGQAEAVSTLMREAGFAEIETRRDLAGIERMVFGVGRGMA